MRSEAGTLDARVPRGFSRWSFRVRRALISDTAASCNKPEAHEDDGEPTIAVSDLETMFVQKRLPSGWELWRKTRVDWVKNTTALLISAGGEYLKLKGQVP
jgi:hypothetical protein